MAISSFGSTRFCLCSSSDSLYSFISLEYSTIYLIKNTINVTIPAPIPKKPTILPILSNFISKGDSLFSFALSTVRLINPFWEYSPTAITIPFPLPSTQCVPDKIKGDGIFSLS